MKNHDILKRYANLSLLEIYFVLWWVANLVIFFAFILAIGFYPDILGYKIGPSSITLGIVCGVGIIVIAILSTGIYTLLQINILIKSNLRSSRY